MTRTVRYQAFQGHAVPQAAYRARGPFPVDLFRQPEIVTDYVPQSDGGGDPVLRGGTAQNGFAEVHWFRCNYCGTDVRDNELDGHDCPERHADATS